MQGSLEAPPIVLNGSRTRPILLLFGSGLFVAGSGYVLANHFDSGVAFGFAFFLLCAALALRMVVSPARLEIGPAGLTQYALWRTTRYAWTDIYDFRPASVGLNTKTVGFDYLNPKPGRQGLNSLNTAIAGVQGILQPGWETDPASLSTLLNQARERWLGATPGAAPMAAARTPPGVMAGLAGARMNRKVFLIASAILYALSFGLALLPTGGRGYGSAFTLFFIRLYAARLHDLGRSGWWQLALYLLMIVGVVAVLAAGGSVELAVLAVVAIQLIFTIVLGAMPGQPDANRFGPAPGQPSPTHQAEAFR